MCLCVPLCVFFLRARVLVRVLVRVRVRVRVQVPACLHSCKPAACLPAYINTALYR
jgi:hypothetical protein